MTEAPARAMDLGPLVAALGIRRASTGISSASSCGVAHDSRAVRPGGAFVAVRGERADGHAFLAQAIAAGARTVVVDRRFADANGLPDGVTTIVVPDTRRALSRFAARILRLSGGIAADRRHYGHQRKDDDGASDRARACSGRHFDGLHRNARCVVRGGDVVAREHDAAGRSNCKGCSRPCAIAARKPSRWK